MTREEAKEFLITISYKLGNMAIEYLTEKDGEKMREAIKALEQQTCEDAVSREAVLMELGKYLCGVPFDEKGIDEVIKELPSVTPQPKTGHWIDVFGGCECSECGCLEAGYSDYCPNCGAKMVEPQERSEE